MHGYNVLSTQTGLS